MAELRDGETRDELSHAQKNLRQIELLAEDREEEQSDD